MMRRETLRHLRDGCCCCPRSALHGAGSDAPLADAAEKMDRAKIRALLNQRVDVNAPQVDGMTALHWAAYQDDLEIAKLLVRAGANVKAANRYGVTPLSLACTNGNARDGRAAPRRPARTRTPPLPGGETPLMTAARDGHAGLGEGAARPAAPASTARTTGAGRRR